MIDKQHHITIATKVPTDSDDSIKHLFIAKVFEAFFVNSLTGIQLFQWVIHLCRAKVLVVQW